MSLTLQQPCSPPTALATNPEYPFDAGVADEALEARRDSDRLLREQRLDEELAQRFPASDPPSRVLGTPPTPC